MSLSRSTIEDLAPDQSSLTAAKKLLSPQKWSTRRSGDEALIWGECQGSGSVPYRVVYVPGDRGYKCSCPSRKFPCKHVLALMWLRVDGAGAFDEAEVPEWITDWMARRRKSPAAAKDEAAAAESKKPSRSLAAADQQAAEPKKKVDPARAAAQKERNRKLREKQVLSGLDELDTWIDDQLQRGFAAFAGVATEQSRTIARRLIDAKATGLASRIEQMSTRLFSLPEADRAAFLIEQLGGLHLVAEAYRRQDELDSPLRSDVRQIVGWNTERQSVLDNPDNLRSTGAWMVVARADEVQPDRLRRIETWLQGSDGEANQVAVLIDFVPVAVGGAAGVPYTVGETFAATLAFYPSEVPLRALIESRDDEAPASPSPAWPAVAMIDALAAVDQQRSAHPWFDRWPLAANDLRVVQAKDGALWLVDCDGTCGLPLLASQDAMAYPLVGVQSFEGFAICAHGRAELQFARTEIGEWRAM